MPDDAKRPIRVLLADLPVYVAQVVEALLQKDGLDVISAVNESSDLLGEATKVDVVVVSVERIEPLPDICSHLLRAHPRLKILVLTDQENTAVCYWVDVRHSRIRPLTGEKLVDGVRALFERTSNLYLKDDTVG